VFLIQGIISVLLFFMHRRLLYKAMGFVSLLILPAIIDAQTTNKLSYLYQEKLQKADEYYHLLNYRTAIDLYQQVLAKAGEDTSIICKIANSYNLLNNSTEAENWYRRAIVTNESTISPVFKLQFAQVLTINSRYDEALYWFKSYYKTISTDRRASEAIKSIENISRLYYDTTFYVVYPISINTPYAEFSPSYYKNGLVFLTDRNNQKTGLISRFISTIDASGNFATPVKFNTGIETKYNEGAVAFYDHFRKMIFCQNYSPDKMSRKQVNNITLQLFFAQCDSDNKWKNSQLLSFEDKNNSYSQPTITEDGKNLYFSSNMPGGFGGGDLYTSKFENGSWSNPINLGNRINTRGDEMFPFIYQDSILYFSSNGHGGLGGLDLFKINLKDSSSLENLGSPMNSPKDDFGIIVDKDGLTGYLTSNRINGLGLDDIYKFKVIRITLSIKITDDKTALPISNAEIYSVGDNGKMIGVSDQEGLCSLVVPVCKSFQIRIERKNYESKIYTFDSIKPSNNELAIIHIKTETKPKEEEKVILADDNNKIIEKPKNVIYKVQIRASRMPTSDRELKQKYKGDLKINNSFEDGWFKYSIGEFTSYKEAKSLLYASEVTDAFITAYIDNKKVHIVIAKATTRETAEDAPVRH
jgi:tetratricopeptide (TPR) repeat protein